MDAWNVSSFWLLWTKCYEYSYTSLFVSTCLHLLGVELLVRFMFTFKAEWSFKKVSDNVTPLFIIFQWLLIALRMKVPPSRKPGMSDFCLLPPQLDHLLLLQPPRAPHSPDSLSHSCPLTAQDNCASDSLVSLLLLQPRTLFVQHIAWLIPVHPSGISLSITSSEKIEDCRD